ncbi:hypothetical protein G3I01_08790 [Gramella sp. MT6]|uniref:hypothetical protein n=1 Tax=Gramella sp. MT6 TaxID=2705471 RepID=UPI001C5CE8F5|nr:hypothetical protein [Gramella sp. MT6]QYA25603.1 hypothetical protein G3I01_08790 [Gramella sp. MT6]
MKQKEIFVDPSLSFETKKMAETYFAIKTVSTIEGFIYSEEEFLNMYKNTYSFNEFRNAKIYAVYEVNDCKTCQNSFQIIVRNRQELYKFLQSGDLLCNSCNIYQSNIANTLGLNFS